MTKWVLVLALFVMAFASNGVTLSKDVLIGTWRLVSAIETTDRGGSIESPFGVNPTGFLTYTADGRMMAIITNGGRKPLSVDDRVSAPAEGGGILNNARLC